MRMPTAFKAMAIMAAGLASGCASKGYERSEMLAERIHGAVAAVDSYGSSRLVAFDSMNALVTEPLENLTARFENFSASVDGVVSADKTLRSALAQLQRSAEARFRAWGEENKTYADGDMRVRSEKNRSEAEESFRHAALGAEAMLAQSTSLVGYLSDLRSFLSNDLSPAGVASTVDFTSKAHACNGQLDDLARPLRASLQAAVHSMGSPATPN